MSKRKTLNDCEQEFKARQKNLHPRDYEHHISLVKYAISQRNKEIVEDNAKLAFVELILVDTCNYQSYLEYNFFFVARDLSNGELGGYRAEVYDMGLDEDIRVNSFLCLREANEDGSGSSCEKGKQSNESSIGMNIDSIGILLSDSISLGVAEPIEQA